MGERDVAKEYELLLVRHFLYIEADKAVRRCISYVFFKGDWSGKIKSRVSWVVEIGRNRF